MQNVTDSDGYELVSFLLLLTLEMKTIKKTKYFIINIVHPFIHANNKWKEIFSFNNNKDLSFKLKFGEFIVSLLD